MSKMPAGILDTGDDLVNTPIMCSERMKSITLEIDVSDLRDAMEVLINHILSQRQRKGKRSM